MLRGLIAGRFEEVLGFFEEGVGAEFGDDIDPVRDAFVQGSDFGFDFRFRFDFGLLGFCGVCLLLSLLFRFLAGLGF